MMFFVPVLDRGNMFWVNGLGMGLNGTRTARMCCENSRMFGVVKDLPYVSAAARCISSVKPTWV